MGVERSACVLVVDGFEEIEAVTVVDVLRRAGVQVSVLGVDHRTVTGSHGLTLKVDASLGDVIDLDTTFNLVVLPGGMPGASSLRDSERAKGFVVAQRARGADIAAICAGPIALAAYGVLDGRRATCFPGHEAALEKGGAVVVGDDVVEDGDVVTSRGVGTALAFALALVRRLVDEGTANDLADKMFVAR